MQVIRLAYAPISVKGRRSGIRLFERGCLGCRAARKGGPPATRPDAPPFLVHEPSGYPSRRLDGPLLSDHWLLDPRGSMALLYFGMAPYSRVFPPCFGNASSSFVGGGGGGASAIFGLSGGLQPGSDPNRDAIKATRTNPALNFDFIGKVDLLNSWAARDSPPNELSIQAPVGHQERRRKIEDRPGNRCHDRGHASGE